MEVEQILRRIENWSPRAYSRQGVVDQFNAAIEEIVDSKSFNFMRRKDDRLVMADDIVTDGTLTEASYVVTDIADTSGLMVGMSIKGLGIKDYTTIQSITDATSIVMSLSAMSAGVESLQFYRTRYDISEITDVNGLPISVKMVEYINSADGAPVSNYELLGNSLFFGETRSGTTLYVRTLRNPDMLTIETVDTYINPVPSGSNYILWSMKKAIEEEVYGEVSDLVMAHWQEARRSFIATYDGSRETDPAKNKFRSYVETSTGMRMGRF